MSWKSPINLFIIFTVLCAVITVFLRVPLPSKGYFNFGDVAVVFAGLMYGRHVKGRGRWLAGVATGLGSAIADIVGGYALFSPITLLAKFLEGTAAVGASFGPVRAWIFLPVGGLLMMGTYFVGEYILPQTGLAGAVSELIPNLIQAIGGAVGGVILFRAFELITAAGED